MSAKAASAAADDGRSRRHGWLTLFYKELLRFWKVSFQTIAAPILTSLLYLLIFSHVLEGRVSVYDGRVGYTAFLVPGLVMMSVLQNAFANSSSSLIQSKITGNLIFVLLPPLSRGRPLRGLRAGRDGARPRRSALGVFVVTLWFAAVAARDAASAVGARVRARSAAPSSACSASSPASGPTSSTSSRRSRTSSSCRSRSCPACSTRSTRCRRSGRRCRTANPFFYMIDGFRYGFFGVSDMSPWMSLAIVAVCCVALSATALTLLAARLEAAALSKRCNELGKRPWSHPNPSSTRSKRASTCEHVEVRGDGQHFEAVIVCAGVRGPVARQAAPARLRGARRPHARGDPRAVDADADARAVGRAPAWISCSSRAAAAARRGARVRRQERGAADPVRGAADARAADAHQRAAPERRAHDADAAGADGRRARHARTGQR